MQCLIQPLNSKNCVLETNSKEAFCSNDSTVYCSLSYPCQHPAHLPGSNYGQQATNQQMPALADIKTGSKPPQPASHTACGCCAHRTNLTAFVICAGAELPHSDVSSSMYLKSILFPTALLLNKTKGKRESSAYLFQDQPACSSISSCCCC